MRSSVPLIVVALGSVGVALLPAGTSRADEAPKREYFVDDRLPPPSTRWKLVVGGLVTTAAFYAAAQPFSYIWSTSSGAVDLRYPVVGPWMYLANDRCAASNPDCSTVWLVARGILASVDGLAQIGGLMIAIEGMFLPTAIGPEPTGTSPAIPGGPAPRRRPTQPTPAPTNPSPSGPPTPLFYLPRPTMVGHSGVGIGWAGVF